MTPNFTRLKTRKRLPISRRILTIAFLGCIAATTIETQGEPDYTLNWFDHFPFNAQWASMNIVFTGNTVADLLAIGVTNTGTKFRIDTDGDGTNNIEWTQLITSTDPSLFDTEPTGVLGGSLGKYESGEGTGYGFGTQLWDKVVYAKRDDGSGTNWTPVVFWPQPWREQSQSARPEEFQTVDPRAFFKLVQDIPENSPYPEQKFDLEIRAAGLCFPCDTEWPDQAVAGLPGGINSISGNKSVSRQDISIGTPGIPLDLNWNYNSVSDDGWRHSYNISLEDDDISYAGGTNDYKVIRTSSGTVPFEYNGTSYESPLGAPHNHTLELLPDDNYLATLDGQQTILFDTNGLATAIADVFSNEVSITYTNDATAGLVVSRVEHSNGLGLDFLYVSGEVDQVLSPSSNLWMNYEYDSSNRLASASRVINGNTNTTTYSYGYAVDGAGMNLVTIVDPVGYSNVTGYATNASGDYVSRATGTSFGATGYLDVEIEYPAIDALPRTVTRHRDGTDLTYSYQFNTAFRQIEAIIGPKTNDLDRHNEVRFEFDNQGNRAGIIVGDWDVEQWTRTTIAYDDNHRPTNTAFGLYTGGYDDIWTNTPSDVWSYSWNTNFETIASITDPEDRTIEFDYTKGLISEVRLVVDTSTSYATTYGYTTNGLLKAVTNANGNEVEYTYDTNGYPNLITPDAGPEIDLDYNVLGHLEKITLPGPVSSMGQSGTRVIELEPDGLGRVEKITYPNNLSETFAYDGVDNLLTNIDTAGRITSYTYEPLGFLSSVTRQLTDSISTQNVTISFDYDQQFNTLEIEDSLERVVESYVLDELDRPIEIVNVEFQTNYITYGVGEFVSQITRFDGSDVLYHYDEGGRLDEVSYDYSTLGFTYFKNDLLDTATNGNSTVSHTYNSVNRLEETVVGVGGLEIANQYTYYPAGQVSSVTSTAGTVTYSYDAAERLTNLTDSVSGSFSYTYDDDNGLVDAIEFPNGVECSYTYDVMDRVTGINYSDSGSVREGLVYTYSNETGMIINRSRESQGIVYETDYNYDTLDRLTGETLRDATGGVLDASTFAYDLAGNRTNKTRNGISVGYGLGDDNNLLSSWMATGATSAVITVSGSSTETVGTDPRYGERTINDLQVEASGTNFWHPSVALSTGSNDLLAVIGDLAGNLGYATNNIEVTIVTNASYSYDAAGNVTNIDYDPGDQELDLVWNDQYQLVAVTNGNDVESYQYDALGRRITTISGTITNFHVYDGIHCIADVDDEGEPARTYTYGPGIDNILSMTTYGSSETNTYYYLTDHLGSVLAITDSDGDVVETYDYDAWGRVQVYDADGVPLSQSAIGNRYTFQGREYSWTTGLYHFRARWYDPVTGRWLSKDPIGISGGLNQYEAFAGNPVTFIDSTGASPIKVVTFLGRGIKVIWKGKGGQGMSLDEAVDLFKSGEEILTDRKTMKEISKRVGCGKEPILDTPKKYRQHFHDAARKGGHGFFASAAGVTALGTFAHYVPDDPKAHLLDFFNPLSIPNDVVELASLFSDDD